MDIDAHASNSYGGAFATTTADSMAGYVQTQSAPSVAGQQNNASEDATLRLRGLPFSATENDILNFFDGLDVVPGGVIMGMNTFRARPSGDAYVLFASHEQREKAMERDRQQIGTRYIELFRCTMADYDLAKSKRDATIQAENEAQVFTEGPEDAVVRVRGLPYQATQAELLAFFQGYALANNDESVQIITAADGRNTGEAYVQFASAEESKRAQEQLNKQHVMSRYVELFESNAHEARAAVVRSAQAKKNYEANAQDVIVRVRGLPFNIQYREIRQFFAPAHIVSNGIHLLYDHMGRVRGDAFIVFTTVEDAKLALTKNRETLQTRYVEVFSATRAQMLAALQNNRPPPQPLMHAPMAGGPMYRTGPAPMYRAPATAMYGGGHQQHQQAQQQQQRYPAPYHQPRSYHNQNQAAQNQVHYGASFSAQTGYNDYVAQQQQQSRNQYYADAGGSQGYTGYDNTAQTAQWSYGYADARTMQNGRRDW